MKKAVLSLFALSLVAGFGVRSSMAIPVFKKNFDAHYVTDSDNDVFVEKVKKAKCNVCHAGKSKKMRNDYGKALSKLLKKAEFKASRVKQEPDQVKKEILEAFKKVEAEKSPAGGTYGERLKDGELPGTVDN